MTVFLWAFLLSALSGLAAHLRTASPLTFRGMLVPALNTGFMGLGLSLVWYTVYADNPHFLVGACVLAGLGG